jgi:hypothetical protein
MGSPHLVSTSGLLSIENLLVLVLAALDDYFLRQVLDLRL